jgi:hypothetical protein
MLLSASNQIMHQFDDVTVVGPLTNRGDSFFRNEQLRLARESKGRSCFIAREDVFGI